MIAYNEVNFYPIPNIDKYYISKCGKALSTIRKNPKIMKLSISKDGYLRVDLVINKKKINKRIHRLVAETFLQTYSEELQVDHIDCDKLNNDLSNLRMVTQSDNQRNRKSSKGYSYYKKAIRAHWCDENGLIVRISFSIKIYGELFAYILATNVREEMVDKYYNRV